MNAETAEVLACSWNSLSLTAHRQLTHGEDGGRFLSEDVS